MGRREGGEDMIKTSILFISLNFHVIFSMGKAFCLKIAIFLMAKYVCVLIPESISLYE